MQKLCLSGARSPNRQKHKSIHGGMVGTVRGKTNGRSKSDGPGSTVADRLDEIISLLKKHRIRRFKNAEIEVEFSDLAYVEQRSVDDIQKELQNYRPTVDHENKEFEQTLYYSSI